MNSAVRVGIARHVAGVLGLEGLVAVVVGHAGGEVRAARRLDDAVDQSAVDRAASGSSLLRRSRSVATTRSHDTKRRAGGHAEQVVEVEVGAEELRVAARRRRGSGGRARRRGGAPASRPAPRRRRTATHRAQLRVDAITSEPRPARVGRNGSRSAAAYRPHWNMPSSSSTASIAPVWRARRKCGSSGIESSDTKP